VKDRWSGPGMRRSGAGPGTGEPFLPPPPLPALWPPPPPLTPSPAESPGTPTEARDPTERPERCGVSPPAPPFPPFLAFAAENELKEGVPERYGRAGEWEWEWGTGWEGLSPLAPFVSPGPGLCRCCAQWLLGELVAESAVGDPPCRARAREAVVRRTAEDEDEGKPYPPLPPVPPLLPFGPPPPTPQPPDPLSACSAVMMDTTSVRRRSERRALVSARESAILRREAVGEPGPWPIDRDPLLGYAAPATGP
jgi:hypothetical protein